ncbi:MAG: RNA methyltransferase [Proteobacteria bacterium]|nr:RNA methyltransferase [Pseudomonadota bacterium]
MPVLSSPANGRLRWVRKLATDRRVRRKEGLWVAEGVRLAEEVLRSELPVRLWVLEEGWGVGRAREAVVRSALEARSDESLEVRRGLLLEVADTETPQGVMVVFTAPNWCEVDVLAGPGPVVVLDRLQDPGNLGTIARTAEGAGAAGLLLTPGCADPGSPKALRASAGSLLRLPTARVEDPLPLLRRAGRAVYATAGSGGTPYDRADLSQPFALLLGQEGGGLAPGLAEAADLLLTVPMCGRLESLNVAATAAVLLFEAARQRRGCVPGSGDRQPRT